MSLSPQERDAIAGQILALSTEMRAIEEGHTTDDVGPIERCIQIQREIIQLDRLLFPEPLGPE